MNCSLLSDYFDFRQIIFTQKNKVTNKHALKVNEKIE